jgi:hypothetical protein
MYRVVDFGCGSEKIRGTIWIGMSTGAQERCNLDIFPYPSSASDFQDVFLDNLLDHFHEVVAAIEEIRWCRKRREPRSILGPSRKVGLGEIKTACSKLSANILHIRRIYYSMEPELTPNNQ